MVYFSIQISSINYAPKNDLTERPILKPPIILAVPILANILQTAYQLTDTLG